MKNGCKTLEISKRYWINSLLDLIFGVELYFSLVGRKWCPFLLFLLIIVVVLLLGVDIYFQKSFGKIILEKKEILDSVEKFRIRYISKRGKIDKKILDYWDSLGGVSEFIESMIPGLSLFIYFSESNFNMLLFFREVPYLIFTISLFSEFVDNNNLVKLIVIGATFLFLFSFLFKIHWVDKNVSDLFYKFQYLYNVSSFQISKFYIHPEFLELLERFRSHGAAGVILAKLRPFVPFS